MLRPPKLFFRTGLLILAGMIATLALNAQDTYLDPDAPVDDRVEDLISRLTMAQKIAQLGNQSPASF